MKSNLKKYNIFPTRNRPRQKIKRMFHLLELDIRKKIGDINYRKNHHNIYFKVCKDIKTERANFRRLLSDTLEEYYS